MDGWIWQSSFSAPEICPPKGYVASNLATVPLVIGIFLPLPCFHITAARQFTAACHQCHVLYPHVYLAGLVLFTAHEFPSDSRTVFWMRKAYL
jgi:hypothetical protein